MTGPSLALDYVRKADATLLRYGGGPVTPPPAANEVARRQALVPGVDKPTVAGNVGPFSITTWQEQYPASGSTTINITAPGNYHGIRFWGTVKVSVAGVTFDEVWFCGPDPDSLPKVSGGSGDIKGCLQNYGGNPPKIVVTNSRVDAMPWVTIRGKSQLNPYVVGLHGGNIDMRYSEVTNVQDGWNWIGPGGTVPQAVLDQRHWSQQNWYHKGYYQNDLYPPSNGQPHCDGFQTNYGRNFTSLGDYFGGARVPIGYTTWPGGSNQGDDFWNSGFLLNQEEVSASGAFVNDRSDFRYICDILIEKGWVAGGNASISLGFNTAAPNTLSDNVRVRHMKIINRETDWGLTYNGNGPGQAPYVRTTGIGPYIAKDGRLSLTELSDITNELTGAVYA